VRCSTAVTKLRHITVPGDAQGSFFDRNTETTCRKCADEDQLLRILADIDETSRARQTRTEFAHVQIALTIRLREPKKGGIEAATVIEVELIGLVDHRLCVDRRAEIEPSRRHAADDARLGRKRQQICNLLFICDVRNAFRHPNAEIDDTIHVQLESRSLMSIDGIDPREARISPLNAASY